MSNEKQIFANGRVAVISTKLFGIDKFNRLADCNNIAEAVRVLVEGGYGGGVALADPNDYDNMLRAEIDSALAELKELCFDKNALAFLLCEYDFVNAKTLMKAKYMRIDGTNGCFVGATYDPKQMAKDFVDDDYSAYPKLMAEGCDAVDGRFADGERSPSVVDVELDRAMYAQMRAYARKTTLAVVKKLCAFRIDATNCITLLRAKKAGYSAEKYRAMVLQGGKVSEDTLLKLWSGDEKATSDLYDEVRAVYDCDGDVLRAEETKRKTEFALLTADADSLSVQPVLVYFARKVREIDLVRTVLIGIKNNLPREEIKANITL